MPDLRSSMTRLSPLCLAMVAACTTPAINLDPFDDRRVGPYEAERYGPDGYPGIDGARLAHERFDERKAERVDGDCEAVVTVERGDTLSEIAEYCDVPVAAIIDANSRLYDPSSLYVGQRVRIPAVKGEVYAGTDVAAAPRYPGERREARALTRSDDAFAYRIRRGDTLSEIAARYDVSMRSILALNPGLAPRSLSVGDTVFVPEDAVYERDYRRPAATPVNTAAATRISYAPVASINPRRGPIGRDIRLVAEDLPPDSDVVVLLGADASSLREYGRFRSDRDGYLDQRVRIPSSYRDRRAVFAVRTADGRYQSDAEDFLIVRNGRASVAASDRALERGRDEPGLIDRIFARDDGPSEIAVPGVLTDEGDRCPAMRDDTGKLYMLLGDLDGFDDGDRVLVNGTTAADDRLCGGVETVQVWSISEAAW